MPLPPYRSLVLRLEREFLDEKKPQRVLRSIQLGFVRTGHIGRIVAVVHGPLGLVPR